MESSRNMEIINKIYNDLADVYLEYSTYESWNDVRFLNDDDDKYAKQRKFFRRKVFEIVGKYFTDDIAKIIYFDIVEFYKESLKKNPTKKFRDCLAEWKDNYLGIYSELVGKQQLDQDDLKKLKERKESFFKKFFHKE